MRYPVLQFCLLVCLAAPAIAQGPPGPVPVVVTNSPASPVPVTGTVKLDGGVGAVTGTMKSGDKTATVFDDAIVVNTPNFGNHGTGNLAVGDYKEVRVAISRSSCSPCGDIRAAVFVSSADGFAQQIDEFPIGTPGESFPWASRTYSVPGSRLFIALRATTSGNSNSMLVAVFGRAN
jgi:hypothetical protein